MSPGAAPRPRPDADVVLATRVHADGGSKPFSELTVEDVKARGEELRQAAGWGPTARVGPVAMAWNELARLMQAEGAATVGRARPRGGGRAGGEALDRAARRKPALSGSFKGS